MTILCILDLSGMPRGVAGSRIVIGRPRKSPELNVSSRVIP